MIDLCSGSCTSQDLLYWLVFLAVAFSLLLGFLAGGD